MIERSRDLLAEFLAKRRDALKVRKSKALLERFEKAKGRTPASLDEIKTFLAEERLKGERS
jgi:hypothetical protein